MSPDEIQAALFAVRWTPNTLARALECDAALVDAWLEGKLEVPFKTGVWLSLLADHHRVFEARKPLNLRGKMFSA